MMLTSQSNKYKVNIYYKHQLNKIETKKDKKTTNVFS